MHLKKTLTLGLLCTFALSASVRADITTGLVLKLQLDETSGSTAADSSGNGNNGSLQNLPTDGSQFTTGRIGGAVRFNADAVGDDVITVPDNGSLNFATVNAFTISAWVKGEINQTNSGGILAKGAGGGGEQYTIDIQNGAYRFFLRSGASGFPATAIQATAVGNLSWQHLVGVFDGTQGTMSFYINSQLVGTNTAPTSLESSAADVSIGNRFFNGGYTLPFTGVIDDVRMFTRALSSNDVRELYLDAGVVAPTIVTPPQDITRFAGENASFTVVPDGTYPLTYQWKKNGSDVLGATNAVYTLTNLVAGDAGDFSVGVSNSINGVVSAAAALTVNPLATNDFTTGLIAKYNFDETSGTNAVDSAGTNTASLINFPGDNSQWVTGRIGGGLLFNPSGDTAHDDLVETDGNIIFNNQDNFTLACWLKLVDNDNGANPRFISPTVTHWLIWSKAAGGVGLFSSRPSPVPQLLVWKHFVMTYNRAASTYELYVNGTKVVTNATNYAKTAPGALRWIIGHSESPTGHGEYTRGIFDDVRIYNRSLSASNIKALYDNAGIFPLQVIRQPVGLTKFERDSASFSIIADGTLPFTIQWQHDGSDIPGATNSTLVLSTLKAASAGNYRTLLNNGSQMVFSSNAVLTVQSLPAPDLANGLIARYAFDETSGSVASDSSGNGNSATLYNFPVDDTQWTTGKIGGALYFNRNGASNNFVGTDAPLNFNNSSTYSFAFWLKRDPGATGVNPRIISPLGPEHWVLWTPNRGLGFFTTVPSPGPISNDWSHFVVDFDRTVGTYTLYVNGQRQVTEAGTYTRSDPTSLPWIIGHSENATLGSDSWRGFMDDMRVYNRLLTISEAELLYYQDSTVGPPLMLERNGNNLSLSWSAVAPGYVLQSSLSIGAGAVWGNETVTPIVAAGLNTVTVNTQTGTKFYRLQKP